MGGVVTDRERREQLAVALREWENEPGHKETFKEPLRGKLVPVVSIPLDAPLLNWSSFRIAAHLADDDEKHLVDADPKSLRAQAVIARLVKSVHRKVDQLKASLDDEKQQTPGVITRDGRLINANTRCVLLRELRAEGKTVDGTLRVAVLPESYDDKALLELELALQQQVELKDEYRLVNDLLMIRNLIDKGFTEEQIAKRLRLRGTKKASREQRIKNRLLILQLMQRARKMVDPPLPLTWFDPRFLDPDKKAKDQLQNWLELLEEYNRVLDNYGIDEAENHLRRWLIAYFSEASAVHQLRHAKGPWVERHVLREVRKDPEVAPVVDAEISATDVGGEEPEGDDDGDMALLSGGLSSGSESQPRDVQGVLTVVVKARREARNKVNGTGDGLVRSDTGASAPASAIVGTMTRVVNKALKAKRREHGAVSKVDQPYKSLKRAHDSLEECLKALEEVSATPAFGRRAQDCLDLASEVQESLDNIKTELNSAVPADAK